MPIFADRCVRGIMPNEEGLNVVHKSVGVVTALNPIIGYKAATRIAKKALETRRSVRELVLEEDLINEELLDKLLSPSHMTGAGILSHDHSKKLDEKENDT